MLAFLVVHLYLALTTSEKPFGYLKAIISGYEEK
jgi:thiosulfate reductase cytochrome b subunit